jgi:ribosomal-protein-alanine N-acetyltransferase
MTERPTLRSDRLVLRPFTLADAPAVQEFAGAYQVALNTLSMPHPYPAGAADDWIGGHQAAFESGENVIWAITARDDGRLMGAIDLRLSAVHQHAEMGYWLAVPDWNQGYMSEAALAVLEYGFEHLGLLRIYATHFARNPASGRVMQKAGMTYEGRLRQHVLRWGVPQDLMYYGILRGEWLGAHGGPS